MSSDLAGKPVRDLLLAKIEIDAELARRGITRTAGPVIGELAERLALYVCGGELSSPGLAAVDLIAADGRAVQVKARALARGDQRFFSFKSLSFDAAICVRFDRATYDIDWAREYTASEVELLASRQKNDWRLRTGIASASGLDVTPQYRSAMASLDRK